MNIDMMSDDRPELVRSLTKDEEIINFGERMIKESSDEMRTKLDSWQKLGEQIRRPPRQESEDLQIDTWMPLSNQQAIMPVIEDYMPTSDIVPKRKSHTLFADLYQARHDDLCEDANTRKAQLDGEQDNLTYGNGLVETITTFDPAGKFVGFEDFVRPCFEWRPSPGFTGMDLMKGQAYYHGFVTPVRLELFKIQYADIIKRKNAEISAEAAIDGDNQYKYQDLDDSNMTNQPMNTVLVKRLYFIDPDTEKYPRGRYIMWCQDLLLVDRPIKNRIPIFLLTNYGSPNEGYGISETSPIRSMYEAMNELLSQAGDLVRKNVNPNRFIKKETLMEIQEYLDAKMGQNIPVDRKGDIEWEKSPQLSGNDVGYIELVRKMSDIASGIHDTFRGDSEYSDQPFRAVMAYQEAAEKRIRMKINREMKSLVKEMSEYKLDIIREEDMGADGDGYADIIPQENDLGKSDYITYDVNMPLAEYLKLEEFAGYADLMGPINEQDAGLTLRDALVGVKVTTGTLQPAGRAATEARALELGQYVPDPRALYGAKQIFANMADVNKDEAYRDWLDRSGWAPIRDMNDRLKDETKILAQKVRLMINNLEEQKVGKGDEVEAKSAEIEIRDLVKGNFLLLGSEQWNLIPPEVRGRIVISAFAMPPESPNAAA